MSKPKIKVYGGPLDGDVWEDTNEFPYRQVAVWYDFDAKLPYYDKWHYYTRLEPNLMVYEGVFDGP